MVFLVIGQVVGGRAYDATVEADYFTAMARIEQRLELAPEEEAPQQIQEDERSQLLGLADRLAEPGNALGFGDVHARTVAANAACIG